MMNLDELALKYGSDKSSSWHDYMVEYEKYFSQIRDTTNIILELGVGGGKSLNIWENYFSKASINGIDITPECKIYEGGRKRVFIGRQEDVVFLGGVCEEIGTPDIIIDDCGHVLDYQAMSFSFLYCLSANKTAFTARHQHNDNRVGAGEVLGAAVLV